MASGVSQERSATCCHEKGKSGAILRKSWPQIAEWITATLAGVLGDIYSNSTDSLLGVCRDLHHVDGVDSNYAERGGVIYCCIFIGRIRHNDITWDRGVEMFEECQIEYVQMGGSYGCSRLRGLVCDKSIRFTVYRV